MTAEEKSRGLDRAGAIEALHTCEQCGRWITTATCDHCWVDQHQCLPQPEHAMAAIQEAMALGERAKQVREKYKGILG